MFIYTYTPLYFILYIYSLCSTTLVDFRAGPRRIGSWQSPTQRPFYGQPPVNEGSTNFFGCAMCVLLFPKYSILHE